MKTFKVGDELSDISICNSDCEFKAVVLKRTEKTVTIREDNETKTRRIFIRDDCECIKPHGRYSMSPTFRAQE